MHYNSIEIQKLNMNIKYIFSSITAVAFSVPESRT